MSYFRTTALLTLGLGIILGPASLAYAARLTAVRVDALDSAATHGDLDRLRFLRADGADLDLANQTGWTPLMHSARADQPGTARYLLAHGANPEARERSEGRTALHVAAEYGGTWVVPELLRRGARVDAPDQAGNTALIRAAGAAQWTEMCILLHHGADPTRTNADGYTALMAAAEAGRGACVKTLLAGASTAKLGRMREKAALTLAALRGRANVVGLLREAERRSGGHR